MTSAALALCVFSVSSAVRPMPYIVAKSALPKLLEISGPMLDTCETVDSVAQDPGNRVSKAVQVSVKDMLSQISPVLFLDTPITDVSPRLVALKCLKMTLSKIQESGEPHETIPTFILRKVVDLLLAETSPPASRNLHFSPSSAQTLTLGLSILELHTTSRALQKEDPDFLGSLSGLQRLLQVQDSKLDSIIEDIQTLYIRVVLNVTNSNPLLCDVFATRVMITELTKVAITNFKDLTKESPPEETSALDRVILSLGALINLTEQSETSRVVFLKHTHASQTLLGQLLRLFLAHVYSTSEAHSVPELNHNVAVGYLAVLLLSLCLNAEARAEIKKQLQSRGLETVMSTVEEFQQYYRKIEQESRPSSAQEETSAFHIRLQDLMSQIQQIEA
ncbi:hypothetical protein N7470_000703 [Penicillium chermesinum]|nr:hypothetical protein N7470_000703 [Penicillium chermesinum]